MSEHLDRAADELRGQIGIVRTTRIGPIDARTASRFAIATGQPDERHGDDTAGDRPALVPPLLLSSTREWGDGPSGETIRTDGTTDDIGLPTGVAVRLMGGGQSLVFERDVLVGTDVTMHAEVTGVDLKSGRSGRLLVVGLRRTYVDHDGAVLTRCEESRVMR